MLTVEEAGDGDPNSCHLVSFVADGVEHVPQLGGNRIYEIVGLCPGFSGDRPAANNPAVLADNADLGIRRADISCSSETH